jgi:DNA-directed RNA polymerase specialized sigma24 family protein
MSSLAMIEPLQGKGIREHLSARQINIPSGVMQAILMHALQLRRKYREVFLLCDIQRYSVEEAATVLGISVTTARRRLGLAHQQMDEVIEHLCGAIHNIPPS